MAPHEGIAENKSDALGGERRPPSEATGPTGPVNADGAGGFARRRLVPLAGAFYAVLALLAWGWRTGLGGQPLLTSTGPPGSVSLAWALALGVLAGLLVVVLSRVATLRTRAGRQLAATLAQSLPTLSRRDVVLLALASGVCEELFFRGAVQPSLGLGAASLLFALAHLIPRWPLVLWSVFALAAGFLFGLLYEHTGSVLAPAVAHVIVNGLNLGWLERRRDSL